MQYFLTWNFISFINRLIKTAKEKVKSSNLSFSPFPSQNAIY